MRRILGLLVAPGLLAAALGCHHTAGICDCNDIYAQPYGTPIGAASTAHVQVTPLTPLTMPPAGEKLDTPKEKDKQPDK